METLAADFESRRGNIIKQQTLAEIKRMSVRYIYILYTVHTHTHSSRTIYCTARGYPEGTVPLYDILTSVYVDNISGLDVSGSGAARVQYYTPHTYFSCTYYIYIHKDTG
jgi:hypothetical protein